jgi:regulator of protease activity HflC (stomatin/prohibitin superfamily)
MLNIQSLLERESSTQVDEKDLLEKDAEKVRTFYSLTGPARKEFILQMAEAESERTRIVLKAQAEGLLAVMKAEADGLQLIDQALANAKNPDVVLKLAGMMTLQQVAKYLSEGQATKLFLPADVSSIFSLLTMLRESFEAQDTAAAPAPASAPQ